MQTIDRAQLKEWMDEDRNFALVEVLPAQSFEDFHLPGAMNVPLQNDDFDVRIQEALPDKGYAVVLYCQDKDCDASPKAAQRLDQLGYEQVYDYEEGKADWKAAGLSVE